MHDTDQDKENWKLKKALVCGWDEDTRKVIARMFVSTEFVWHYQSFVEDCKMK